MSDIRLTSKERKAVEELKALAKRWPRSLWLFSASGSLCVMRSGPQGEPRMTPEGGVDPKFHIDTIQGIRNDGGDW